MNWYKVILSETATLETPVANPPAAWDNFRFDRVNRRKPRPDGAVGQSGQTGRPRQVSSISSVFETYVLPLTPEIRSKPPSFLRHLLTAAGHCPPLLGNLKQKILDQLKQLQLSVQNGDTNNAQTIGQQCSLNVKRFIECLVIKNPNQLWDKFVAPKMGKMNASQWQKLVAIPEVKQAWDSVINAAKNNLSDFDLVQQVADKFVAIAKQSTAAMPKRGPEGYYNSGGKMTKMKIFLQILQPNLQDIYPPAATAYGRFNSDMSPRPKNSPQLNAKQKILRNYWNEAIENPPYGNKEKPSWYLQRFIENVRTLYEQNNKLQVPLGPRAYPNDPNKLKRQNIAKTLLQDESTIYA